MTLKQWIKHVGGVRQAAEILGISGARVNSWAIGVSWPTDKIKIKIVKKSNGRISYKTLVESNPIVVRGE